MEFTGYILFALLAAFVGSLALIARSQARKQRIMDETRAEYRAALAQLQSAPADPVRQQRVVEVGTTFAHLARDQHSPLIFDEATLRRDLDSVLAGNIVVTSTTAPTMPRARSVGGE
jgi:hypothetical protein